MGKKNIEIYGQINEWGEWSISTNAETQELCGKQDLVAVSKKGRLRWLGLAERMEDNRGPKLMLYGRPEGRRKKGRQRLKWLDDVEEDLRERERSE
jgi:hypothetical protein